MRRRHRMRKLIAAGLLTLAIASCSSSRTVETSDQLRRYPPPAECQTEDEGTIVEHEDGSVLIVETGCVLDAEDHVWRTIIDTGE
jgi:hypothetical protein